VDLHVSLVTTPWPSPAPLCASRTSLSPASTAPSATSDSSSTTEKPWSPSAPPATQPAVARIWRAHGLRPWRRHTFKLSNDPAFVDKLVDVVGLYVDPPARERAVVLCFDKRPRSKRWTAPSPASPWSGAGPRHAQSSVGHTGEDDEVARITSVNTSPASVRWGGAGQSPAWRHEAVWVTGDTHAESWACMRTGNAAASAR
jgi:hypothetical protein